MSEIFWCTDRRPAAPIRYSLRSSVDYCRSSFPIFQFIRWSATSLGLQFHGHGVAAGRSSVSRRGFEIPLLLIAAWLMVAYFLAARGHSVEGPIWLPVWLTMPLLAGLFYHVLVVIALASNGTPGWYLNILAPFLAFAMGLGIERISRKKLGRAFLRGALIYAVAFLIIVMWSQVALFSGCAIKNNAKLYQFDGQLFCLDRLSEIAHRLSIIGWPNLSIVALGGGLLCIVSALSCSPLTARIREWPTQSLTWKNG